MTTSSLDNDATENIAHDPRWKFAAPLILLALSIIPFADVLFVHTDRIAAANGTDVTSQFIAWRTFGFDAMRHGHLPLWNPHIYGGAPYFAGFQSALLYPPNWIHLFLPVGPAINWLTVLHVFLAGYFTFLWCRYRSASPAAALLAGAMFMFCGPFFPHIFAGHLPHVAVIAWLPLIFLAIDGLADDGRSRWMMLGAGAVAATILAGHPQYVYYTGIIAALYTARRVFDSTHRLKLVAGFGGLYLIAVAVTAIQLIPGISGANESVRSGGLPQAMASTFSLPPENAFTLFAPAFFGAPKSEGATHLLTEGYFGRTYLWETSLFLSVTGLCLALIGLYAKNVRARRGARTVLVIATILALGRHTPLYQSLYDDLPKYNSFRGTTKFAVFAALFIALLAAAGFDELRRREWRRAIPLAGAIAAALIAIAAIFIRQSGANGLGGLWASGMASLVAGGVVTKDVVEMFPNAPSVYSDPVFLASSAARAASALLWCSLTFAAFATILWFARRVPKLLFALPALVVVEMLAFAFTWHATTPGSLTIPPEWSAAIHNLPKDQRVFVWDIGSLNSGMALGFDCIWGYDPGVLKRYAEMMYASQNHNPSDATQDPPFDRIIPTVFPLLRCGLILAPPPAVPMTQRWPGALPVALLVHDCVVLSDRDDILRATLNGSLEPRSRVILDREPAFRPERGDTAGDVQVVRSDNDELELRVDCDSPVMLLITNNFAEGWHAHSLEAVAPQSQYAIQPADWALQAIALKPGKHHILLEYVPTSFRMGRWISLLSLLSISAASLGIWTRSSRVNKRPLHAGAERSAAPVVAPGA